MHRLASRGHWAAVVLLFTVPAFAGITADQVESYVSHTSGSPGTAYWGAPYTNSAAGLGLPAPSHGLSDLFDGDQQIAWADDSILTPYSAAFHPDHVVVIAEGGHLTLRLSGFVPTSGRNLGVHAGVGLIDISPWQNPVGQNATPAGTYTSDREAAVSVSLDGLNWVSVGQFLFDAPSNYYSEGVSNPHTWSHGTTAADFFKPFNGTLADFSGRDWTGTLDLLDGSAGGTWLDLTPALDEGLSHIRYVRFDVGEGQQMVLDAVVAVPEPAAVGGLMLVGLALLHRRRANSRR
jgi:hypothetical protein